MTVPSVAQLLRGRPIPQVSPRDSLRNACEALCNLDVGALAVVEQERLVGIISERDITRKCVCRTACLDSALVEDVMTGDPITGHPKDSLAACLTTMWEWDLRHLPIVENGRLCGLLSIRDISAEQRVMLKRYTSYLDATIAA